MSEQITLYVQRKFGAERVLFLEQSEPISFIPHGIAVVRRDVLSLSMKHARALLRDAAQGDAGRVCSKCRNRRPLSEFNPGQYYCRGCKQIESRDRYAAVRGGAREIPGVRIYSEDSVSVRS